MTITSRAYTIEGKDVGALKGTVVQFPVFANRADLVTRCADEASADELAQSAFDVWLQGRVRALAGKGKTAEEVQAFIDGAKYARRIEGATPKAKSSGEIVKAKAAAAEFDALKTQHLEKSLTDPKHLKDALRFGLFKQADFDAYKARRAGEAAAVAESTTA